MINNFTILCFSNSCLYNFNNQKLKIQKNMIILKISLIQVFWFNFAAEL